MNTRLYSFNLSLFVILCNIRSSQCLNLQNVEEGPCIVPPVDKQLDFFWITNIAQFYYPIISKYALYKHIVSVTGTPIENISDEMAYNACPVVNINDDGGATISTIRGNGKSNLDILVTDQGVVDWIQKRSDGSLGYRGRAYTTLTDNDKYLVTVSCYESENQKSYEIASSEKTLDEASKRLIWNHLKSFGFDLEKTWIELKYDNCHDLISSNLTGEKPGNNSVTKPVGKSSDRNNSSYNSVSSNKNNSSDEFGGISSNNGSDNFKVPFPNQNSGPGETVIHNQENISTTETIVARNVQTNPINVNGQVPQNVIIIYNNDPTVSSNNPTPTPAKKSEYRNSADIFFDIFRTAIDFLQNAYKNGVRYLFLLAQRVIGQFNSFRHKYTTSS